MPADDESAISNFIAFSGSLMNGALSETFALAGRVAVITGAASGIGRETARVLAEAGARTVIADINTQGLAETAAYVAETGIEALPVRTDIAQRTEVEALAARASETLGRIDIWVNCAGTILSRPIVEVSQDDLDRILSINLQGVYWGCAAAAKAMMRAGSGSIINMSSSGAETAVPGISLYSMSKAAVNMLTRTAASEFGPHGIRVNAVAPGWVDTPMGTHGFRDENGAIDPGKREAGLVTRRKASPLGIVGTPRDIALAVLYLASDASRFMTGQIMRPNGGVSMP